MIVLIDNYDSFTFNVVQTLTGKPPGAGKDWQIPEVRVFRNDKISIAEIEAMQPDRLIISPGPCTPKEAGISVTAIEYFSGKIPVLGICLGHQAIGAAFGGNVIRAGRVMHGKTSQMHHDGKGVFTGIESPFQGMRYHSLMVEESSLPDCLEATAHTEEGELMALRHRECAVEGVQFHPESIMTEVGQTLLANFLSPDYPNMLR